MRSPVSIMREPAFVKDLERDLWCVAVQCGGIDFMIVFPRFMRLLHHEDGGRLRQMAVEQFLEFVASVEPGRHGSGQPDRDDQPEQQHQKSALERAGDRQHARHDGWPSR
jgi:hypothetical protein